MFNPITFNNTSELVTSYKPIVIVKRFQYNHQYCQATVLTWSYGNFPSDSYLWFQLSDKRKFLLSSLAIISDAATKRHKHTLSIAFRCLRFAFESEGPLKCKLVELLHGIHYGVFVIAQMSTSRDSRLSAGDKGRIWNEANRTEL